MALTATTFDHTGKKLTATTLPKEVFDVKVDPKLLALAIAVYRSNQRQGSKAVQTRGDVAYSNIKLWRQKGTGRARHGSRKAPVFVGGGKAHGPSGVEAYHKKLTRRMRRLALLGALSQQSAGQHISVITNSDKISDKTKEFAGLIGKITEKPTKTLYILHTPQKNILQSAKNLKNITITQANRLNTYEILNHRHILINKEALELLTQMVSPKKAAANPAKTTKEAKKGDQ